MTAKAIRGDMGWRLKAITVEEVVRDCMALGVVSAVAAPHPYQDQIDLHNQIRDHVVNLYQHAFDGTMGGLAQAGHLALRKHKPADEGGLTALFLILGDDFDSSLANALSGAARTAYAYSERALGHANWGQPSARAEAFANLRAEALEKTPGLVLDRARDEVAKGLANHESPAALARRLDNALATAKEVEGERVAQTEATVALGTAVDATLHAVGYTHKKWLSQRDDRVRHSHEECDAQGVIPLGATFVNGLRYPGQADAPPEEVINCRCVLVGVNK